MLVPASLIGVWSITATAGYRAIRYTERLAEAEAVAMAEALNSLFKAECIRNPVMRPRGGWKSVSDVEIAVAECQAGGLGPDCAL